MIFANDASGVPPPPENLDSRFGTIYAELNAITGHSASAWQVPRQKAPQNSWIRTFKLLVTGYPDIARVHGTLSS